ncbi:hypothetical protein PAXRUDRAFT_26690 [Paxillus rubicundulus Ve08.2h10]|uniref:DUF6589 domain-containing protein n=1 Tax=Paxillus rubicundulus Ve08.2h10 TaxID=930991 RepID=A0A0D0DM10_9AGAM|nr:hypothetical protein PAXRUDRAFT_26690 [Paxillus rubicundulus Ve08.2h10]
MQDNMLVNLTGLKGHFMPVDLNIEHLIRFLKHVRKQVGKALGIAYHRLIHIAPDTSASVNKIAHKVNELLLHQFTPNRDGTDSDAIKPVIDTLASGEQKLKSSTLAMFNKKVWSMLEGEGLEVDEDELPQPAFDLLGDPDNVNVNE